MLLLRGCGCWYILDKGKFFMEMILFILEEEKGNLYKKQKNMFILI